MNKNKQNPFAWNDAINKMFTEDSEKVFLEMSMRSQEGISRILEESDVSVTSDELFRNGEIIEDSGDYEQWYSDAPGGSYHRIKIVKYKGKIYVYKEKVTVNRSEEEKSECVAFYELK